MASSQTKMEGSAGCPAEASPSGGTGGDPGRKEVRGRVIAALAQVRAAEVSEIEVEIAASGGDLEIDSEQAVTVISILEGQLDRELAGQEELRSDELTSLNALTSLISRHL
jgi:acyl carrier protein